MTARAQPEGEGRLILGLLREHEGMQSRNIRLMVIFPPAQARAFAKVLFLVKDPYPISARILHDHGAGPG